MGMIYLLTPIVIQSEAKNLGNIYVNTLLYATEILPPFGRLNDKWCQDVYCSLFNFQFINSQFSFFNSPILFPWEYLPKTLET